MTGEPFGRGGGHRLLHVAHHRAGTVWMRRVLTDVADAFGLRLQIREGQYIRPWAEVVFHPWVPDGFEGAGTYRGSHLIRDPRDMVVSGYHYHRRTDEAWAHAPRPRYGGRSYQEFLQEVDPHRGLMEEIERFAREEAPRLRGWDYGRPQWLELRYEDLRSAEEEVFVRLFEHYGFTPGAVERAVATARRHSTDRPEGRRSVASHGRSGASGQWRAELTPEHLDRFKQLTGDLVVVLGYEATDDW